MGAEIKLPDHPIFSRCEKIFIKELAPILLSKGAKPVLKDGDTNAVIIAETKYGKGYVMAIGDPGLYNEYIDHERLPESFENLKAANKLVGLLLKSKQIISRPRISRLFFLQIKVQSRILFFTEILAK